MDRGNLLHERPDYKEEAAVFEHLLATATPVFDKCAEDGMRYRVYRFGSVEVRTIQAFGNKEVIAAVFSLHAAQQEHDEGGNGAIEQEQLVKATEYIEGQWHFYVVLET